MRGSSTAGRSGRYSYALVIAQFTLLGAIGMTGPLIPTNLLFLTLEALGIGLGVWAVLVMRLGRFNIRPEPAADASLVRKGPYRWLRHPMYTSVLLISAALVGGSFTPMRLLMWGALCGVLTAKLLYEEELLAERFPQYRQYKEGTWRLIPYVW